MTARLSVPTTPVAAWIGIDRSDQRLDVCLQPAHITDAAADSQTMGDPVREAVIVENTPEAIQTWLDTLRQRFASQTVALCFEQPAPALLQQLAHCDFGQIYAINPVTLARYREAFTTSRAKDDRRDACYLMEIVRDHHAKLPLWQPKSADSQALDALVQQRRAAVNLRTLLTNQLTSHLKSCFPQALPLAGTDLYRPMALAFLRRWPTLQALKRVRLATVRRFYTEHGSRSRTLIDERLQLIKDSVALGEDGVMLECAVLTTRMLVDQLEPLAASIAAFEAKIEELFSAHEDAFIFASLPGAGAALQPRLLAALGSDRSQFETAQDVQKYSGIAPIIKQSGKSRVVQRRYARPKFTHQTFMEYAGQSIPRCAWAQAFYQSQVDKGKSHWAAVRALAFKWIRIIFVCWQRREAYDDERYVASLHRRRSPLCARLTPRPEANT